MEEGKMNERGLCAVVLGATGLVGAELTQQLLVDPAYARVVTLGRREAALSHEKLTHHRVDFEQRDVFAKFVRGDVFFSAMGTTLKVAGSQQAQRRVDYDYQYLGLAAAKENGVRAAVLVSSTGADPKSSMFYLRMKGELEQALLELGIPNTTILRPGMLDGDRKEHRPGEKWGLAVARFIPAWDVLAKVRPVHASVVARAARSAAQEADGARIWEAQDIFVRGAGI